MHPDRVPSPPPPPAHLTHAADWAGPQDTVRGAPIHAAADPLGVRGDEPAAPVVTGAAAGASDTEKEPWFWPGPDPLPPFGPAVGLTLTSVVGCIVTIVVGDGVATALGVLGPAASAPDASVSGVVVAGSIAGWAVLWSTLLVWRRRRSRQVHTVFAAVWALAAAPVAAVDHGPVLIGMFLAACAHAALLWSRPMRTWVQAPTGTLDPDLFSRPYAALAVLSFVVDAVRGLFYAIRLVCVICVAPLRWLFD